MYWIREIMGWVLIVLGLWLFYLIYFVLLPARKLIWAGPVIVMGIFVGELVASRVVAEIQFVGDAAIREHFHGSVHGGVADLGIFVTHAPGDASRLFIAQRGGAIRILNSETGSVTWTFRPGYGPGVYQALSTRAQGEVISNDAF